MRKIRFICIAEGVTSRFLPGKGAFFFRFLVNVREIVI